MKKGLFSLAFFAGVLCVSSLSFAGFVSDPMFTIEATNAVGQGGFDIPLSAGNPDGDRLTWTLPEPVLLIDENDNGILDPMIDTWIQSADVLYVADPIVTLNFVVSSGSATNFTVNSALLSFPTIPNARGRATAAVTATDFNGNGASLTGLEPSNKAYQAFYNNSDPLPLSGDFDGSSFARLVGSISSSTPFSSVTGSENFPVLPGFSATDQDGGTLGAVSNMGSRFSFRVSPGDSASGTSSFIIIPEPASMLLVVVGGCLLSMVRRRYS